MKYCPRLPRKLKKQLKKDPEGWAKYQEERRIMIEREKHMDKIFTRDYSSMGKVLRRMIKTGR